MTVGPREVLVFVCLTSAMWPVIVADETYVARTGSNGVFITSDSWCFLESANGWCKGPTVTTSDVPPLSRGTCSSSSLECCHKASISVAPAPRTNGMVPRWRRPVLLSTPSPSLDPSLHHEQ